MTRFHRLAIASILAVAAGVSAAGAAHPRAVGPSAGARCAWR
jgi:hypothetical protein